MVPWYLVMATMFELDVYAILFIRDRYRRFRADCYTLCDWKLADAKRIGQEHVTDNKLRSLCWTMGGKFSRNGVSPCDRRYFAHSQLTTICDSLCSNRLSPKMRRVQEQCEWCDALDTKPIKISFSYGKMKGTKKMIIIAQTTKHKSEKKATDRRISHTISGIMRQQPWQPISLRFFRLPNLPFKLWRQHKPVRI